jgi:integrase
MLAQGVPIRVISEVLGHADSAITSRVYAHVAAELARDAAARVDELLRASQ